jgi:DUF4097 and DUF4098 domain-containing protein YvlB
VCTTTLFADEWNKTYTVNGKPDLKVETSDAAIRVSTWDKNTIEARVTTEGYKIGDGGLKIIEHQTGNLVEIEVKFPHDQMLNFSFHNRRVEIAIQMPKEGNSNLHTGDGSIRLSGLKGSMNLYSGDGSIELDSVDGNLIAHTSDGHIRSEGRFDSLELNSGDGRIEATALAGSKLGGEWSIHTGDGNVSLRIPDSLAANLEMHTGDGHIDCDLPITTSGSIRNNTVSGKLNGGGNLLTIRTGDGSIRLGRS